LYLVHLHTKNTIMSLYLKQVHS